MSKKRQYINDYGILRQYGESAYKLVGLNCYCMKSTSGEERKYTPKGEAGNEQKLDNNLSRSKNRVLELALCNPWEWYVTLTLDPAKYDRTDLGKFIKDLSQHIRDHRKKTGNQIKYLLIPERHQDGCWHMHGFLLGLPETELHQFTAEEHLPYRLLDRIKQGHAVYKWEAYVKRFGYSCIEPIRNQEAASRYITKYITKETMQTITELNAHTFYASKGLASSVILMQDLLSRSINEPDYSNDYVSVKWFDDIGSALALFDGGNT